MKNNVDATHGNCGVFRGPGKLGGPGSVKNPALLLLALFMAVFLTALPGTVRAQGGDAGYASGGRISVDDLNAMIQMKGGKWVAEENPISILSDDEKARKLGLLFPTSVLKGKTVVSARAPSSASLPTKFDWRNNSGDYVTPIRDQGDCGACWAFATTAALESQVLIAQNTPGADVDLCEQIVLSCSGAGNCDGGYIETTSDYLVKTGTGNESCYPYTQVKGPCEDACSQWEDTATRLGSWTYVSTGTAVDETTLKSAIYDYGPVVVSFRVYTDFDSYSSGVYSYTTGKYRGAHAVLVVGWDDSVKAFIVKNSWGPYWGENGYFRIAYKELSGTTQFAQWAYAYSGAVVQTTSLKVTISPAAAVSAGAMWNVDGGEWQASEATDSTISAGTHTVAFKPVSGWTAPASRTVTVSEGEAKSTKGTYVIQTGSLKVTLKPSTAVKAGAMWKLDSGAWQANKTTLSNLSVGKHTITSKKVSGWTTPAKVTVTISKGKKTAVTRTYTK